MNINKIKRKIKSFSYRYDLKKWIGQFYLIANILIPIAIAYYIVSNVVAIKGQYSAYEQKIKQQDGQIQYFKGMFEAQLERNKELEQREIVRREAYSNKPLSEESIKTITNYVCEKFGSKCEEALKVMSCEGGFFNNIITGNGDRSRSVDAGMFQVNSVHRKRVEQLYGMKFEIAMLDPFINIDYSHDWIYKPQGGFQAWSASNGCHHQLASKGGE